MARIVAFSRVPVKANRKSPRPDRPFGQGIALNHTPAEERWYYARLREMERDEPTNEEYDAMAAVAAWEYRYEMGLTGDGRCALCGRITDDLTGGLCDGCALSLDATGPEEDPEGGVCPICHAWSDFVERDTGLCPPCTLAAEEATIACQNKAAIGQRRVY